MYKKLSSHIKYPKLIALFFSILSAYVLFQMHAFTALISVLNVHGYFSLFIGGILFAFGFTAPFAVGIFLSVAEFTNPFLGAVVAGIGSVFSDLCLFRFVRFSFMDEFKKLQFSAIFRTIKNHFHRRFSDRIKKYFLWTVAGFLIASPLPDEFGVILLSGFSKMNAKIFAGIAFTLNTCGIFLILVLSGL